MKILFATSNYPGKVSALCGVGTYMAHEAEGLAAKGHEIHVLLLGMAETRTYEEKGIIFHEAEISVPSWTLKEWIYDRLPLHEFIGQWKTARFIKKLVSEITPDLIETTHFRFPCLFYLFQKKRPVIVTRAVTTQKMAAESRLKAFSKKQRLVFGMENASLKRSDFLVTHTKAHAETVQEETGIPASRFTIIPLGVPMPLELPVVQIKEGLNILYVGRLDIRKGVDILIRTLLRTAVKYKTLTFTLAGEEKPDAFKKMFLEAGGTEEIYGRIAFEGKISDERLMECYRSCDIFISPSRYESFGLTFVEAMSHGKPVVGLRVGGTPEVVTHQESGFLAENENEFFGYIEKLIEDRECRLRIGFQAREDAEKRLSADIFVENMERYFQSIYNLENYSCHEKEALKEIL